MTYPTDDELIRRGDALMACGMVSRNDEAAFVENLLKSLPAASQPADPVTNAGCRQPVQVKPLDWVLASTVYDPGESYEAICPVGVYVVAQDEDSPSLFNVEYGVEPATFLKGQPLLVNVTRTIETAKAAAQADFEARIRSALTVQPSPDEHYDDYCIRQFAKLMSEKMAASRAKGRSGWHDPERCSIEYLRSLLYEHLDKGDPVDVANFCMMLRHYEASTYREFCNCTPQPSPDVAAKVQALVDAATKAKIILAEFEPHPLPVLGELLAALAALKEGEA